jgi:hypothetical protein
MKPIKLSPAQLDAALGIERKTFDAGGHVIGCSEWAKRWEAHWGRVNLDASTLKNLDEAKRRGRAGCCRHQVPE